MAPSSMVGGSRAGQLVAHLVLVVGVITVVTYPIYTVFVASTHTLQTILRPPLPMLPAASWWRTTARRLAAASTGSGAWSRARLLANTTIVALAIAVGKIVISIASAYAIVFFRFPLRMVFFG